MSAAARLGRRERWRGPRSLRTGSPHGAMTGCLLRRGLTLPLTYLRDKMRPLNRPIAERCESGRIDMLGKHASRQRDRGFESHPLRHSELARPRVAIILVDRRRSSSVIGAGPCAIEPCESRQVRKEATVSGPFCVPQDHLAPLLSLMVLMTYRT
jgi:hypothetical protein